MMMLMSTREGRARGGRDRRRGSGLQNRQCGPPADEQHATDGRGAAIGAVLEPSHEIVGAAEEARSREETCAADEPCAWRRHSGNAKQCDRVRLMVLHSRFPDRHPGFLLVCHRVRARRACTHLRKRVNRVSVGCHSISGAGLAPTLRPTTLRHGPATSARSSALCLLLSSC